MASAQGARGLLVCLAGAFAFSTMVSGKSNGFLSARTQLERTAVDILAELEDLDRVAANGYEEALERRADRLEEALRRVFNHAPKDRYGQVSPKTARYLLHRLFVERHGWFVVGVEDMGAVRNQSRTHDALHSGGHFSLRQLARFASTLEVLVHGENVKRLEEVFTYLQYTKSRAFDVEESMDVIQKYMARFFTTNVVLGDITFDEALEEAAPLRMWPRVRDFGEEVRSATFVNQDPVASGQTLWEACLEVVEEIGERYGKWQDLDCHSLKNKLLNLETPGTGRVPLSVFWDSVVQGKEWQFVETVPYLNQMGALQGSQPPHQSVLIPNYVYSNANCFSHSMYYDTCCINECHTLLGEIESQVDGPSVAPHRLLEIVSSLPSSTVDAPRVLKPEVAKRLSDIAARNDGVVPLHGRLFAQFLHHAFPRECPYPAVSATNGPENEDTRMHMHRTETEETQESQANMMSYVALAAEAGFTDATSYADSLAELPWSDEEEFFMAHVQVEASFLSPFSLGVATIARRFFLIFSFVALGGAILRSVMGSTPQKSANNGLFV